MQELQDRSFDDYIARALKAESTVSSQQQQRAWEALRARAAQQTMLPPPTPSLFERLFSGARLWGKTHFIAMVHFFLDDSAYCRVPYRYPTMMRHQRPHSTFSAAEIMLLA